MRTQDISLGTVYRTRRGTKVLVLGFGWTKFQGFSRRSSFQQGGKGVAVATPAFYNRDEYGHSSWHPDVVQPGQIELTEEEYHLKQVAQRAVQQGRLEAAKRAAAARKEFVGAIRAVLADLGLSEAPGLFVSEHNNRLELTLPAALGLLNRLKVAEDAVASKEVVPNQ